MLIIQVCHENRFWKRYDLIFIVFANGIYTLKYYILFIQNATDTYLMFKQKIVFFFAHMFHTTSMVGIFKLASFNLFNINSRQGLTIPRICSYMYTIFSWLFSFNKMFQICSNTITSMCWDAVWIQIAILNLVRCSVEFSKYLGFFLVKSVWCFNKSNINSVLLNLVTWSIQGKYPKIRYISAEVIKPKRLLYSIIKMHWKLKFYY